MGLFLGRPGGSEGQDWRKKNAHELCQYRLYSPILVSLVSYVATLLVSLTAPNQGLCPFIPIFHFLPTSPESESLSFSEMQIRGYMCTSNYILWLKHPFLIGCNFHGWWKLRGTYSEKQFVSSQYSLVSVSSLFHLHLVSFRD